MLGKAVYRSLNNPSCSPVHRTTLRSLHLAPPFLLDEPHRPRFTLLNPVQIEEKETQAIAHLKRCNICPRFCDVNRFEKTGVCLIPAQAAKVATIGPHFGEEVPIQGHRGSGSIFFSGCNLRCVFCQNHSISHTRQGEDLTPEQLADWCLKLQAYGVHNINFVTPEHVSPLVARAILNGRAKGLHIPIVYNTSGYESVDSLRLMDGLVDIYLPDFKVWNDETGKRLLKVHDYPATARQSIIEMHRQVGDLCFTPDGLAKKGVLLRHLVMPGKEDEGCQIMGWLGSSVSTDLFVHIMGQYHPDAHVGKPSRVSKSQKSTAAGASPGEQSSPRRYEDINRFVKDVELASVREAAVNAGLWRFHDPVGHAGYNI